MGLNWGPIEEAQNKNENEEVSTRFGGLDLAAMHADEASTGDIRFRTDMPSSLALSLARPH